MRGLPRVIVLILFMLLAIAVSSCQKGDESDGSEKPKLKVVTSLFPVYDFARNVGGDRVKVTLLLPPGVEPHSFDPTPADILNVNKADIFIFTNRYMEPWVADIIKGMDNNRATIVDASTGIVFMDEHGEGHNHESGRKDDASALPQAHINEELDPHIWLDFDNAVSMVDNIRDALIGKDPAGREYYMKKSAEYKAVLQVLHEKFVKGLSKCEKKEFINGGHFAFGYFAKRYGLTYIAAYGFSPDAEPTPGQLVKISRLLKKKGLKYIFHEELLMSRVAETLSKETGAQLLFLHGAHNISREEFEKGVTFVRLMEENLENLKKGLECQKQR
jgi:zinc transport system substrate-binding protein